MEQENGRLTLRVARAEAPALTAHLLNTLPVVDLAVEDPPIEAVIDQIYQEGGAVTCGRMNLRGGWALIKAHLGVVAAAPGLFLSCWPSGG